MTRPKLDNLTSWIISELSSATYLDKKTKKKKILFRGAGTLTSTHFVHMCSLLGLLPLYCFTFAEVSDPKLGPGSLISISTGRRMNSEECKKFFRNVHSDLVKIWGVLITLALLENMLCELKRSYDESCITYMREKYPKLLSRAISEKDKRKKKKILDNIPLDIILDKKYRTHSKKCDLLYEDQARGCVQNFFLVKLNGNNATALRPILCIKISKTEMETGAVDIIPLTNWCKNTADQKHLMWESEDGRLSLSTDLKPSKILVQKLSL